MLPKTQSGYLLLADISGYTSFLAQTEIDHANIALSFLLEAIVEKLSKSMTISKLEGDAVFAYLEQSDPAQTTPLLELIDQTYLAFRTQMEALKEKAKSCSCRACVAIPTLDLKFMVHHGSFMIQHIAGIRDLLGHDVNLVHRLMKNQVSQSTGWKAYALFTHPSLKQMQADKGIFIQQIESYEHLGDVQTYVIDMHARYEGMRKM